VKIVIRVFHVILINFILLTFNVEGRKYYFSCSLNKSVWELPPSATKVLGKTIFRISSQQQKKKQKRRRSSVDDEIKSKEDEDEGVKDGNQGIIYFVCYLYD